MVLPAAREPNLYNLVDKREEPGRKLAFVRLVTGRKDGGPI
jgi:hypothetical protein